MGVRAILAVTLALAATALTATGAEARQPISASLVDCGILSSFTALHEPARRESAKGRVLTRISEAFFAAAERQAAEEGQIDPAAYVQGTRTEKAQDWRARGIGFGVTGEFRDWLGYCQSLGTAREVLPVR